MKPDWLRILGVAVTVMGIAGVVVCLALASGIHGGVLVEPPSASSQQRELASLGYRGILLSFVVMTCGALLVANARRRRNLAALEREAALAAQSPPQEEDVVRPRLLGTPTQRRAERRRRSVAARRRRDREARA